VLTVTLAAHPTNIENHKRFMRQVLHMTIPNGWRGHHTNRARSTNRAAVAGDSGPCLGGSFVMAKRARVPGRNPPELPAV
jgi:hypothetical protein